MKRTGVILTAMIVCAALYCASATAQSSLPFDPMAQRIVLALAPEKGETAVLRYDPTVMPELEKATRTRLESRGVKVQSLAYGPAEKFEELLARTDIYVWLPTQAGRAPEPDQAAALGRWLDVGRGRQIHFHWADGTRAVDGGNAAHNDAYDRAYLRALDVNYAELDRRMEAAIQRMRSAEVRVTTPAGTDLRFRIGERPVTKQNGDASPAAMKRARVRIDREIELPAGVLRVAPVEESVGGWMVIPRARIHGAVVEGIRLRFEKGVVQEIQATKNEAALRSYLPAGSVLRRFREFAVGLNLDLLTPRGSDAVAYYGYGSGVVRLSLGDNTELGGNVRGGAVHWFFFPDAKVFIGSELLVNHVAKP